MDGADSPPSGSRFLRRVGFGGPSANVFRGMAVLLMGSAAGRAVGVASMPILTRLYSPDDFGVLAVFTALVVVLAPIASLRYVLAIPLPRQNTTALNLLFLSFCLILGFCASITLLLAAFSETLLPMVSMDALIPWWWLIAIGVFSTAIYEMFSLWATRARAYRTIAATSIWQETAGAAAKIGFGILGLKPIGLLVGQIIAQGGGVISLARAARPAAGFRAAWRQIRRSRVRHVAWHWRGFPAWRVPSQGLLVLSQQAVILFAAAIFSPHTTGQLSLAMVCLALPLNIIGNSAGQALYAEAAREPSAERVRDMARHLLRRLTLVAILPAAILLFLGEWIFGFAFGSPWEEAGIYAQILSVSLIFQFSSTPIINLLNLVARQSIFLFINIVRVAVLICVFSVTYYQKLDSFYFIALYSAAMCLFYPFTSWVTMRAIGNIR